jgi:hypothetical protein
MLILVPSKKHKLGYKLMAFEFGRLGEGLIGGWYIVEWV